ncbi:MAG: SBBP repeat-containing protein [Ignavibacteria bacterium]|nr:SBBP repeat-containing protein [Ignavibacteria bacterium]
MKTKIIFIGILLSTMVMSNSHSQVTQRWLSTYNYSSDEARAMVIDSSGNVYVTGRSATDYATVKYNSLGIQQWAARYNGPGNSTEYANSIAVDGSGNVYVTGGSIGISTTDYATIKYNASGVEQWVARYNGPGSNNDEAFSIAVDSFGNVYVTGYSYSNISNFDYATIKYNSAGILQWVTRYNGTANNTDFAFKLAIDGSGNVYVTGWSRGAGTSGDDFATIKYNSAGAEQWVRIYNGSGDAADQPSSIVVDAFANVYVTGRSLGDVTQYDYSTIKYNSSGDSLWVKRYNGIENSSDNPSSLAVDAIGNVYVTGQSYFNISNYDYATVKYNSSGVEQWARTYNGPGNSVDYARSITVDLSGNVYITGSSAFPGQNYNYATVKYDNSGNEGWSKNYNGTANGSDEAYSIASDANGNVYVTGASAILGFAFDFVTIKYSPTAHASINCFIQGFYNSSSDYMNGDTVKCVLRNNISPYSIKDSSKAIINSSGSGTFYFANALNGSLYYIVLNHRNSLETWSSSEHSFSANTLNYNFSISANKAFGNNQIHVDASPLRFAIYSGDINQDDIIDASDLSSVENDASISLSGYVSSDVTGDEIIDASDISLIENNVALGISLVRP